MGKLHLWEFTRSMGTGTVAQEIYINYIYMNDKTLGPTVDPSGLQGPPASSLLCLSHR